MTALKGVIEFNSLNDTNIISSNLLVQDIDLNVGGDLNVESKQNEYKVKSNSFAMNLGGGVSGQNGTVNNGSLGFNTSNSNTNRLWVDNQASIIGTNSVNINVGTKDISGNYVNGGNTNIIGAKISNENAGIDLGNLTLNTATLTYANLYDYDKSNSNAFGMNLSVGQELIKGSGHFPHPKQRGIRPHLNTYTSPPLKNLNILN